MGGGIRSLDAAKAALESGARRVIVGSALFQDGKLSAESAEKLATEVGSSRLVFALDAVGGLVTIHGWQSTTAVRPLEMIQALDRWCDAFLYTHVDTEGLLGGFPQEFIRPMRAATTRPLIAAGGIRSQHEIAALPAMRAHAVASVPSYPGLTPAS